MRLAPIALGLQSHNLENAPGRAKGLLEGIVDAAHPADRVVQLDERDDESHEQTNGHPLVDDLSAGVQQKGRDDEDSEHLH